MDTLFLLVSLLIVRIFSSFPNCLISGIRYEVVSLEIELCTEVDAKTTYRRFDISYSYKNFHIVEVKFSRTNKSINKIFKPQNVCQRESKNACIFYQNIVAY